MSSRLRPLAPNKNPLALAEKTPSLPSVCRSPSSKSGCCATSQFRSLSEAQYERNQWCSKSNSCPRYQSLKNYCKNKLVEAESKSSVDLNLRAVSGLLRHRSRSSLPHGDERQFWLDASNQFKISITMQKRYACKNSMRRYQASICGARGYACPLTSRIQMSCAAR